MTDAHHAVPFPTSPLPETVRLAFAGKAHLTAAELGRAADMSPKMIRGYIDAGLLKWRHHGFGSKRIHRVFILPDVEDFYRLRERGGAPCPSIGTKTRPTGNSISSAVVLDFAAQRKSRSTIPSVRQRPSRRKSVGRPTALLKKLKDQAESP
jgi:hypothetical protein